MADFRPETLLALDIETVPDTRLLPSDWLPEKFPKIAWHEVVAISFVVARIVRDGDRETYVVEECRSGGDLSYDEPMLLRSFWRYFAERTPRLVTWNGRSFDLAVLRFRAMMHGIPTDVWTKSGDKWAGYHHRYSPSWHYDLMEQCSDYGSATRLTLQEASVALGYPGKIGGSGGTVTAMMKEGRLDAVRAYCECDSLLTFGVYMHWAFATGLSTSAGLSQGIDALVAFLDGHARTRPHFAEFRRGWRPVRPDALTADTRPKARVISACPTKPTRFGKIAPPPPDARSMRSAAASR